jgi:hypothetical protein
MSQPLEGNMIISHQFCHAPDQTRCANQTKVNGQGIWGVKKLEQWYATIDPNGASNSISGE